MVADLCSRFSEVYRDAITRDHRQAMACRGLEAAMQVGIMYLRSIKRCHEVWKDLLDVSPQSYDLGFAKELAGYYQDWLQMTEQILPRIEAFEAQGFSVDNAFEVRQRFREVSLLPPDVDCLLRSFDELESGGGMELDEFIDSIPNPRQ